MELEEIKNYLRIDDDMTDDDNLLLQLQATAKQYVANTTGKIYVEGNAIYDMVVLQLIAHWYDNRTAIITKPGALSEIPYTITSLLTHLAYSTKYPTGGNPK